MSLSDSIPNKHISMLQSGQRSSGSAGSFGRVLLFADELVLAMIYALFLMTFAKLIPAVCRDLEGQRAGIAIQILTRSLRGSPRRIQDWPAY